MRPHAVVFMVGIGPASPALAEDRGGTFDVHLDGGALVHVTGATTGLAPIAQVVGLRRFRVRQHFSWAVGLAGLPAPQVTALTVLGRLEWLPVTADAYVLMAFLGTRLAVIQPLTCVGATTCGFAGGGGALEEVGLGLRTGWLGGYRLGVEVSGVAGPIASYGQVSGLTGLYVGGTGSIVVGF